LSGLSAGCICWFRQGNSDSRKYANEDNNTLIKVSGLDYIGALIYPHYDVEKHRQGALKMMMKNTKGIAIALENCSAIEVVDDNYRILTSMKNKNAWKVYWCRGQYFREKMVKNGKFQALAGLLQKKYDKHLLNVFLIFPSCHIVPVQTISAAFQNRRLSCQV
jgi:hypothetical protein